MPGGPTTARPQFDVRSLSGLGDEHSDGRRARGERTRRRVAEALLELLQEGHPQPTAKQIADRAGVSLRLVFHHFEDMEALYHAMASMQFDRHWRTVSALPPDLPLGERVERTVRQRSALFEAITPVRRAALLQVHRSAEIAGELSRANRHLHDQVAATFEPELERSPNSADLLETLDLLASWETWDRFRRVQGLSVAAARRVLSDAFTRLLEPSKALG